MGKRKNVLLILSDQQRIDTISAYQNPVGGGICRTPHIDALSEDGMLFTNAYCSSAICAPSRASLNACPAPSMSMPYSPSFSAR